MPKHNSKQASTLEQKVNPAIATVVLVAVSLIVSVVGFNVGSTGNALALSGANSASSFLSIASLLHL